MKFVVKIDTKRINVTDLKSVITAVTDPVVLDGLAKEYKDKTVILCAIAKNKYTYESTCSYILDLIRESREKYTVHMAMINNPNLTKSLIDRLSAESYISKSRIKKHPNYIE